MDSKKEKTGWGTIPQFGGWDYKQTDYSMVFQRARANRKQQKADVRSSFGNEQEIIATHQQESPADTKKKFLTYINCCIRH